MHIRSAFLASTALAIVAAESTAQPAAPTPPPLTQLPPNAVVAARLRDGSTIYGRIERQDADSLVIVGSAGRMAIAVSNVRDVRGAGVAHQTSRGTTEYWYPNANDTRLFFGPTGRTLKKGEGYFADHDIFLWSASAGLSDRVQLGAGSFIIPNPEFWYVLPKVAIIQRETFNLAAGALYGGVGGTTGGIGYLVATWGGADRSLTAGVGQGISGAKVSGEPVAMLGGEARVSRRIALVTENYVGAGSNDALLMYGMRFLGEKISVDLALMNSARNGAFPGIPYVDFVIKW